MLFYVHHLCQTLKLVLKETFRLHSPVPLLLPRETIRHCMINGYDILPKTSVFVNAAAIGHDPFGAGRRICPGILYGTAVVEHTMANLLHCFNWEFPSALLHLTVSYN
eukprot:TRINITY_DN6172_c0_g1_i8.p1 TRINITY_DN6172_c0_g1~~TRINITY_DN6172_c0_g1_i8.p1  ORF type:complete len:108 (-),score=17.22 TRINITY_DN6172_c0_g1_i8:303-626(-)